MQDKTNNESRFDRLLKEATEDSLVFLPNTELMEGRIIVRRQIGSGGMGVVYEASDLKHSSRVALKVLSEVNPAGIYRLKQEFRALADVSHPNLVSLHELFLDRGQWFFTMELIEGTNLLDYLAPNEDSEDLQRVFLQLAAGIRAIHDSGKLHRDLKPNNVLVTPEGQVKILDFGLVSDQEAGGVGQTIIEEGISGTPTYMAPEQAGAKPAVPASDWYAFGVMLFEALTGRPPFEDTSRKLIQRKQIEDPPRPSSIRSNIPAELDTLCTLLLAKNPNDRAGFNEISNVFGKISRTSDFLTLVDDSLFVGREAEMGILEGAFKATDRGTPVLVFVEGPSGIGKSTLVERFLRKIVKERRAVVLKGRCYERESVPFKTCDNLIDELSRYIRRLPENRASRLMPRHIPALAKIFPVLNRLDVVRQTKHRHPLPMDPNELRRVAFGAAKEMLAHITAQEPLILYVDDLQWSDVDGVKLLAAVVSKPDPPALLFVGAYRSEDSATSIGLNTFKAQITELGEIDVRTIELVKLSDEEAETLAGELLPGGQRDVAKKIAEEGRGSPFIISELARFAATSELALTDPNLKTAIETRISGLSDEEREVIAMLSVSASPIEESVLRTALGNAHVSAQLRNMEALRLIRQTGGHPNRIAIYHDQIREAVFSLLPAGRAKAYHQMIANALEASQAPDPIALTEHLLGADNPQKAGIYAAKAAHWAADILAFDNAARLYRLALDYNPGDRKNERRLQTALGEALSNAGHGPEAAEAYKQAAEGAPPQEAIELRRLAAQQWINTGHMDEGMAELGAVLKTVGLKLHSGISSTLFELVRNRLSLGLRGLDFEEQSPEDIDKKAMLKLRTCESIMQGLWAADPLQSAAFNARYLRLALDLGSAKDVAKSLAAETIFRSMKGADGKHTANEYLTRAEQLADRIADPEIVAFLSMSRGLVFFFQSEFYDAARHLRLAEKLCIESCTRKTMTLDIARSVLGTVYARTGSWTDLQKEWEVWYNNAKDYGNLYQLAMCQIWPMGAFRHLAADDSRKAREMLAKGFENWPFRKFNLPHMFGFQSKTYIHLYDEEYPEALEAATASHRQLKKYRAVTIEGMRVNSYIALAQANLGLAANTSSNEHPIKQASKMATLLSKERCANAIPYVPYIMGMVAHLRGNSAEAVVQLRSAVEAFKRVRYKLYAAAVGRQLGRILGSEEGEWLVAESDRQMREEAIVNPARVANMLTPGYRAR